MTRPHGLVVAIDGPAGSGKSSTAKAVASRLGYRHLDSGAFYRAITLSALDEGIPPADWPRLDVGTVAAFGIDAHAEPDGFVITRNGIPLGDRLRSPAVTAHVSRMAAVPAVRVWLLDILRRLGREGGLVADGRDIGTVVFPDAELKVFLVCNPEERARRRLLEYGSPSPTPDQLQVETQRLVERDRSDESRDIAPLVRAPDAVTLDTTGLSFEQQVERIVAMIPTPPRS